MDRDWPSTTIKPKPKLDSGAKNQYSYKSSSSLARGRGSSGNSLVDNNNERVYQNYSTEACSMNGCCRLARWKHPGVREALELGWVSLIMTSTICVSAVYVSYEYHSMATLAFCAVNALDSFSALALLWRFWGREHEKSSLEIAREHRAQCIFALSFIVLSLVVGVNAIYHLSSNLPITDVSVIMYLAIPAFFLLAVLGVLKLYVAKKLNSRSLKKSGVTSLAGAKLGIGVFISTIVYEVDHDFWWIDSAFAVVIATTLCLYGLWTLSHIPRWWTRSFWFPSEKSAEGQNHPHGKNGEMDEDDTLDIIDIHDSTLAL